MAEIEIQLKISEELIKPRSRKALEQLLGAQAYTIAAEVKRERFNEKLREEGR